jgi:DNA-directed RNA polymerase subunit RPC12/RpoP
VSRTRAYRCLNCLEHTIDREFDTSHLSVTCPNCDSFERFVNEAVFQQFEAYETSPPPEFEWNRLDRTEKLIVAERLVRSTKTLDDFEVVDGADADGEGDPEDAVAEVGGGSAEESVEAAEESVEAAEESVEAADRDGETTDPTGEEATSGASATGSGAETA